MIEDKTTCELACKFKNSLKKDVVHKCMVSKVYDLYYVSSISLFTGNLSHVTV